MTFDKDIIEFDFQLIRSNIYTEYVDKKCEIRFVIKIRKSYVSFRMKKLFSVYKNINIHYSKCILLLTQFECETKVN